MVMSREARRKADKWLNSLPSDKKFIVNARIDEGIERASASVMDQIYVSISATIIESEKLDFNLHDINEFINSVSDYLMDAARSMEEETTMGKDVIFDENMFRLDCIEMFNAGYNQKRAIEILKKKYPDAPKAVIPVYYKKFKEDWVKPSIPVKPTVPESYKPQIKPVDPSEFRNAPEPEDRVKTVAKAELEVMEAEQVIDVPEVQEVQEDKIEFIYPIKAKYKGETVEIVETSFQCSEGTFDDIEALMAYKEEQIMEFSKRMDAIAAIVSRFK